MEDLPPPKPVVPSDANIRAHPTDTKMILVRSVADPSVVWECARYCPHNKVDLLARGMVRLSEDGKSKTVLICPSHYWRYILDDGGATTDDYATNGLQPDIWSSSTKLDGRYRTKTPLETNRISISRILTRAIEQFIDMIRPQFLLLLVISSRAAIIVYSWENADCTGPLVTATAHALHACIPSHTDPNQSSRFYIAGATSRSTFYSGSPNCTGTEVTNETNDLERCIDGKRWTVGDRLDPMPGRDAQVMQAFYGGDCTGWLGWVTVNYRDGCWESAACAESYSTYYACGNETLQMNFPEEKMDQERLPFPNEEEKETSPVFGIPWQHSLPIIMNRSVCLLLALLGLTLFVSAQNCGCPSGMCCSQWGYCGTSGDYCGSGCRENCGSSGGSSSGGSSGGSSSGGGGDTFSGDATYFDPGLGACGTYASGSDYIAALNAPQWGADPGGNPNRNTNCGRTAVVSGPKGSVTVKIQDKCPPCKSGDLDLSPSAFDRIADRSQGRVHITWKWA
ncbi:hypothetical protein PROFUN_02141 [Planoprotostelium fungivorum]|uniref:Chitin-binding type-1 domain-containing protein n=1 Tax=Planoprotostelium fungivorum TaxID=1890364 RepID=A0A2P6NZ88_9EUKA|nr:hypothetical protein PROFUN_02141 [Planoprotostelium fungivorum]